MSTIIATLFAAQINKTVINTDRTGTATEYKIAALAEKTGTMKNGDKAEYLVLAKVGDESTTITVHPQQAKELMTKGAASGMVMDLSETVTEVVAEVVETAAEVVAEQPTTMADLIKADKPVSKKARAIALVTTGWANKLVRKDIIAQMMTDLNLSAPGASTYYQNIKSGAWTTEQAA